MLISSNAMATQSSGFCAQTLRESMLYNFVINISGVLLSLCCDFLFMTSHACFVCAAEPADPTAGMSAREKKMYELQQRLRQSRKANENAVIAEKRRQQVSRPELLYACLSAQTYSAHTSSTGEAVA